MSASTPWSVAHACVDWHEAAPSDPESGDIYFSRTDGRAESECVFLHGNHLAQRWSRLDPARPGVFVIAETGFGSGLNFLLAQELFLRTAPAGWQLHYVSVEHRPWQLADLLRAHAAWPELRELSDTLLGCWPPPLRGPHRLHLSGQCVRLTLLFDEALPALAGLQAEVHAWFLDGFAPARNGDIWRTEVLREIARLSVPGTTFATYTAAGTVRQGLQAQGFEVQRLPGFAGKRHRLEGRLPASDFAVPRTRPASALIVGAGFAGVCSAAALARRGIRTAVVDAAAHPAAGASGVPRAVLYLKLSGACSEIARLQLQALCYATTALAETATMPGSVRGVLQIADAGQCRRWRGLDGVPTALLRQVDRSLAGEIAGITVPSGGLWFPNALTLPGADYCASLLASIDSAFVGERQVTRLLPRDGGGWALRDAGNNELGVHGDVVVCCTGPGIAGHPGLQGLPVCSIRGQLSHFSDPAPPALRCVLTGEGHVIPAPDGGFFAGSSYVRDSNSLAHSPQEDRHNLARAAHLLGRPESALAAGDAWTGLRCAGPDHLPAAGAMPGPNGNYSLCGLRSRGLLFSPLLAEAIASHACGEPLPLTRAQWQMLRPARWL